jgi:hypothetical protein
MASQPSHNFGALYKLPPEIRLLIWKEFRPRGDTDPQSRTKAKGDLAILRVCRQLHEEIIPEIYNKEIMRIGVGAPGSPSGEWLVIENEYGANWIITDTQHALYEKFCRLPFKRLKRIRIEIHDLEPGHLALLHALSKDVRDLVSLLEKADGLPPLEIELVDTIEGKWSLDDGTPRMSIPDYHVPDHIIAL